MRYHTLALLLLAHSVTSSCPVGKFITVNYGGRLGNCVWEYVSLYAVAKLIPTPHAVYSQAEINKEVTTLFDNVTLPVLESLPKKCKKHVDFIDGNTKLSDFFPLTDVKRKFANVTRNIVLQRCIVLIEPVMMYMEEIKRILPYKRDLVAKADNTLREMVERFTRNTGCDDFVYVGVHIRRTDYITYLPTMNLTTVDEWYYKYAMEYFKHRSDLGRPVFVIATDDPVWAAQQYQGDDVFIAKGDVDHPQEDLVLLSKCNHSIIDYGTFGLWTALFVGGETVAVYQKDYQEYIVLRKKKNWHFVHPVTRKFV